MSDTSDFQGHRGRFAVEIADVDRVARRAQGILLTEAIEAYDQRDVLQYELEPGAVDLSRVRTGRAPLLVEHRRYLSDLVGVVEEVALADGALRVEVRFGRTTYANELWGLARDGIPLSLSVGAHIRHAEPIGPLASGGTHYRADDWLLAEVSVCVFGYHPVACLTPLDRTAPIAAQAHPRLVTPAALDAGRAALHRRLRLDRWRRWSPATAVRIAARLGLDMHRLGEALDAEIEQHIADLERDHLLPVLDGTPAAPRDRDEVQR